MCRILCFDKKYFLSFPLQAYAISAIAHWDWPDTWPDLFGILMHALLSDDNNFVHGAMRVLTEFSSEVTASQLPQVAPIILPQMCLILTEDTVQLLLYTLYIIVFESIRLCYCISSSHVFHTFFFSEEI